MKVKTQKTEFEVQGIIKNTATYFPTADDSNNLYTAPTHGIVNGVIHQVIERGSRSLQLENREYYMKNDPEVTWIRIHHISYEGVDFGTW